MSMLSVRNLFFSRPSGPVLSRLDLDLGAGERVAILGPSGSGKTTLLRLIAGLEPPERGEVIIGGRLASDAGRILVAPRDRSLGFVFQEAALWPHMRVIEHLSFASPSSGGREAGFAELLSLVGLEGLEDRYPDQLSGGEARRVGLARALAARPACLLMDEPLTNLDHHLRGRLLETIDQAVDHLGACLVYVTHEPAEARSLAPRLLHMSGGRLEEAPQR